MALHKLIKPSGQEVTVNDNSLEHALSIGWTKKPEKAAAKPKAKKKAKKAK